MRAIFAFLLPLCIGCSSGNKPPKADDRTHASHDSASSKKLNGTEMPDFQLDDQQYFPPERYNYLEGQSGTQGYAQTFYPIGFSHEGSKFAYLKNSENGGCGSCDLRLYIHHLPSNLIVDTLDLHPYELSMEQDMRYYWNLKQEKISDVLLRHEIVQQSIADMLVKGRTVTGDDPITITSLVDSGYSDWYGNETRIIEHLTLLASYASGRLDTLYRLPQTEYAEPVDHHIPCYLQGPHHHILFLMYYMFYGYEAEVTIDYRLAGFTW